MYKCKQELKQQKKIVTAPNMIQCLQHKKKKKKLELLENK